MLGNLSKCLIILEFLIASKQQASVELLLVLSQKYTDSFGCFGCRILIIVLGIVGQERMPHALILVNLNILDIFLLDLFLELLHCFRIRKSADGVRCSEVALDGYGGQLS